MHVCMPSCVCVGVWGCLSVTFMQCVHVVCMCVCACVCVCRERVLVLMSMYSAVSLTLVREQPSIKIIYYYYYIPRYTVSLNSCSWLKPVVVLQWYYYCLGIPGSDQAGQVASIFRTSHQSRFHRSCTHLASDFMTMSYCQLSSILCIQHQSAITALVMYYTQAYSRQCQSDSDRERERGRERERE